MLAELYEKYKQSAGVSTDTRTIIPGSLFFALKGPRFDANTLAGQALEAGASFVVIDNPRYKVDKRCILVEDSLLTLQELARYHRARLKIPVIGLTGSNGKTTCKELIAAVFRKKYKTFATKGNLNNHIGVPISILSINADYEMAVIEMGANHQGEIALLSSIALPTHGFITNIGRAHIEGFGGVEGILKGKTELYKHLISNNGQVFMHTGHEKLMRFAQDFKAKPPVFYPTEGSFYHTVMLEANPYVVLKADGGDVVTTHLPGAHNFDNLAIALCIGKYFEVPEKEANAAVAAYAPDNNRSQLEKRGSNTFLLDAYNANPDSMMAALEVLDSVKSQKKAIIIGDMLELGDSAEQEHRAIGKRVAAMQVTFPLFIGPLMAFAAEEVPGAFHFANKEALLEFIQGNPFSDTTILIKASRSIGLDKIADAIH